MATSEIPFRLKVSFPGDIDQIPLVRQLFSDTFQILHFSPKCSFRSELLVDELCNTAMVHGSRSQRSSVELLCEAYQDRVEFSVIGDRGCRENGECAREAVAGTSFGKNSDTSLLRMLCDSVTCAIDKNNASHIRVVRKREG